MASIHGTGVLLVSNKRTLGPCLVLILDYHGKWSDMGGKLEAKYTPTKNAVVEVLEESRGVINLLESSLGSHVDLPVRVGVYRSYICEIADQSWCTQYNRVDTTNMPYSYQETKGMRYFPLQAVLNNIYAPKWASDSGGSSVLVDVHGRVQNVVDAMHKKGLFNKYIAPAPTPTPVSNTCSLSGCSNACSNGFNFCSRSHGRIARGCLMCNKPCSILPNAQGTLYVYAFCSQTCGRASGKIIMPILL